MQQRYATPSRESTPTLDPVTAGLDPSLLEAFRQNNPLAIDALAGRIDNSLLLAAMGPAPVREPGFVASSVPELDRPDEMGRDWAQDDIDRRKGPPEEQAPEEGKGDGSGEHGQFDPTAVDQANYAFWRSVAVGADAAGYPNAGRHMNHYLDNTGGELAVDLQLLMRDDPAEAQVPLESAKGKVTNEALETLDGADTTLGGAWEASTPRDASAYFTKGGCPDWFYAIGGHTTWLDGECSYVPDTDGSGSGTLVFDVVWHLVDNYNWDEGKSVTIMGIRVDDTVLGRLHEVGLAHEYPIAGALPVSFAVRYEGQDAIAPPDVKLPGDDRDGTRSDPDRERA